MSSHGIGENELIALDIDVVGCHGYYSDFSRTFRSGSNPPSEAQRKLYKTAYEQVHYNISILKPGMAFREHVDKAWEIPEKYYANRYYLSTHGTGMTAEYPYLYHHGELPDVSYAGVTEPELVICVESYIGEERGCEVWNLRRQVLATETSVKISSKYPFDEALLQ